MGLDQLSPRSGPATATAQLLPSHRFYTTTTTPLKQLRPIYAIPVHFLRRRGLLLFLLCIATITYLHYLYLLPSADLRPWGGAGGKNPRTDEEMGLPDYMSVARIWEPPLGGAAPINGVDEDGFEIIEDPFTVTENNNSGRLDNEENNSDKDTFGDDSAQHHQQQQDGSSDKAKMRRRPIQYNFQETLPRTGARADLTQQRLVVVKDMIHHAWTGYIQQHADDLDQPRGWSDGSAAWAESVDTLLLAGMTDEVVTVIKKLLDVNEALQWNLEDLDREVGAEETPGEDEQVEEEEMKAVEEEEESISLFEDVARHLGGLLSVVELEKEQSSKLLPVVVNVGDRLAGAFHGTYSAPRGSRIFLNGTIESNDAHHGKISLAEVGAFQLEFRKLSQLSGDNKYRNIADKNFEYLASLKPRVTGLYPAYFDPDAGLANDFVASFGNLSDSFYEYLLKTFMLTGDVRFKDLYISTIEAMHNRLISRPHRKSDPFLVLGVYDTATESLVPKMDHQSCFAPGLLALGSRVLGRPKDMIAARGLMETCYLSYKNSATGLGADEIAFLGSEYSKGHEFEMLPRSGFYIIDPEYNLRPETVESLFILYRITGDAKYQDYAWEIVQAIERNCKTKTGYSTLANVMDASEGMTGRMPSHFLAQTLKYLYLIFSPPEVASLDNYLFTTEGHLFKYPIT